MNDKKLTTVLIGVPAAVLIFFLGVYVGGSQSSSSTPPAMTAAANVSTSEFAPFWKAWDVLNQKFAGTTATSTTDTDKVYGAIAGLAASYEDPYTVFFPPVEAKLFKEEISGNFEGVGMEIGIKEGQLTVITPLKGSPSEKAGLRSGDKILAIDKTVTTDITIEKAVKLLRGAKGTTVTVTILPKDGTKPTEKIITRDVIDIPTIDTSLKPGNIFVIRLYSFTSQSPDLFRTALREFVASGSHKLVLDLRGNPGGYLDAAWDMASWFLPAGEVIVTEDFGKNGEPHIYRSKGYNIFDDKLKMIILVDGGSASAAEILAGALSEQGAAKLLGTKTFGKGSVQELVQITADTSLKVTVARWLTPGGHNLSHDGLEPDVKVEVTEKDTAAGKDVQLEKALELLAAEK